MFRTPPPQDVEANSPAELAGLHSHTDYIIGADSMLHESEDLFQLIETHEGKPLKLFVYNSGLDACREVTITPNSQWGGEGRSAGALGQGRTVAGQDRTRQVSGAVRIS